MSRSLIDLIIKAWENHVLLNLMLELTYRCELACQFCYNEKAKEGRRMTIENYRALLEEARGMGTLYLSLTGGEPTLHPDFFTIGRMARDLGFAIRIKSHGAYRDPGMVTRIKEEIDPAGVDLSIHGACATTHDTLTQRPGSFDLLMKNIERFQEEKIFVSLRCPITRLNEKEIEGIDAIARSLGIRVTFDPQISPRDDGDKSPKDLSPTFKGLVDYYRMLETTRSDLTFVDPETTDDAAVAISTRYTCGAGVGSLTVDPFGVVLPCVAWRRPVGNLFSSSLKEIWEASVALAAIRRENEKALFVREKEGIAQAGILYCPGRAEAETGSPLTSYEEIAILTSALRKANEKKEES